MKFSQRTNVLAGLLLLAGLAGCGGDSPPADAEHAAGEEHAEAEEHAEGGHVVALDSLGMEMSDIEIETANTVQTGSLALTGTITYDANRVSHVGPKIEGRIARLNADLGSRVTQGQTLAVLESAEVGGLRADYGEARALVEIALENFEREQRLESLGISSRRELLDAEADLQRAQSAMESAVSRLEILGAEAGSGGEFALRSPFDGVVVEKHASRGEVAGPADQIFTVADLSTLWIELDVFERNLSTVEPGQPVRVTTAAYPNRSFPGRIVYVGDILDPETRTVRARVEIENPAGLLKPGMFVRAVVDTPAGEGPEIVVIPRAALQNVEGTPSVWVPADHPGEFIAQPVEAGAEFEGDQVEIVRGLEAGARFVSSGAFTLTSELSAGEFQGHSH